MSGKEVIDALRDIDTIEMEHDDDVILDNLTKTAPPVRTKRSKVRSGQTKAGEAAGTAATESLGATGRVEEQEDPIAPNPSREREMEYEVALKRQREREDFASEHLTVKQRAIFDALSESPKLQLEYVLGLGQSPSGPLGGATPGRSMIQVSNVPPLQFMTGRTSKAGIGFVLGSPRWRIISKPLLSRLFG
jgi:hypothetical protein